MEWKTGNRLSDNEVEYVAKMQIHIDHIEKYFFALHDALWNECFPQYMEVEGSNESHFFEELLKFLEYVAKEHHHVLTDFTNREQQAQQEQKLRLQAMTGQKPMPSWERIKKMQ